jgi:HPt (histidine-containing phosphotransfer) domain-containing protein
MSENAMSDSDDAPVDMVWLRECTDNDKEMIKTLLGMFFERTGTYLDELDAAIAAGNAPSVRRISHACAGSAGTCGMAKLAPLFKALEQMGLSGKLDGAAATAATVRIEYAKAKAFADGLNLG